MSASVRFDKISKDYPEGEKPAVDSVSLEVVEGEVMAIVGASGSGKTTLLRIAAGLEVPSSGELLIGNEVMSSAKTFVTPEKRRVGMVFQEGALFPHLNVYRNICYGLRGMDKDQQKRTVDFMLAMVGLGGMYGRFPHELSGGERQRLALARSLAPKPDVILLDEPFSNLDPKLRRSLREEVLQILRKLRATAMIVTHDTDDAMYIGDRIAVLGGGRVVQVDSPQEIYHRPADEYCAQLFGVANFLPKSVRREARWFRPEDARLINDGHTEVDIAVTVEQVRDIGSCMEVLVRPVTDAWDPKLRWHLQMPFDQCADEGDRRWVRL